jgi:hypothetical protein
VVGVMLTISKLKRWSINYYIDTAQAAARAAKDAQRANGGSRSTRMPQAVTLEVLIPQLGDHLVP